MKTSLLAGLALLAFLAAPALAQSLNDAVRIEVQTKSKRERSQIKNSSASEITQLFTLQITLRGKPKSPETRTGKWTLFGRTIEGKGIVPLESGDFKVELPSTRQQTFETPEVATTYTPPHSVVNGNGGGQNAKSKKVPGEGTKYFGYSVVIKDGDKIVGELYSEPSLEAESR